MIWRILLLFGGIFLHLADSDFEIKRRQIFLHLASFDFKIADY